MPGVSCDAFCYIRMKRSISWPFLQCTLPVSAAVIVQEKNKISGCPLSHSCQVPSHLDDPVSTRTLELDPCSPNPQSLISAGSGFSQWYCWMHWGLLLYVPLVFTVLISWVSKLSRHPEARCTLISCSWRAQVSSDYISGDQDYLKTMQGTTLPCFFFPSFMFFQGFVYSC